MIRILLALASHLLSAVLALLVASWVIPQVTLHVAGFIVAVLVFALAQSVLTPLIFNLARKHASAVLGGIGLISTLVALWLATLFPGGLEIVGLGWMLAPLLVWLVTAIAGWILTGVVFKRVLENREARRKDARNRKAGA